MTQGSRYSEQKKRWWSESLGDNLVDSRTILPREGHERIKILAEQIGERVPILLGKFVMSSLSMFDRGKAELPAFHPSETAQATPHARGPAILLDSDVFEICSAIISSRFPDDTGAGRMRQSAMVLAVATETAAGRKPTATSIARISGNQPSSVVLLATVLEERGVLSKVRMAGASSGRSAKVLHIRADALEAINAAHLKQVGSPIVCAGQEPSDDVEVTDTEHPEH